MQKKVKQTVQNKTYVILHNVRSVYNVGAIFRTAEAVGVSEVILSGYTPSPTDRFGRERKDIAKTALGAEKIVAWRTISSLSKTLDALKKDGVYIVAVEQSKKSVDYKKIKKVPKIAFVFGNEVKGLSDAVLQRCDITAEIPMRGKKESLNISIAVGIILFST